MSYIRMTGEHYSRKLTLLRRSYGRNWKSFPGFETCKHGCGWILMSSHVYDRALRLRPCTTFTTVHYVYDRTLRLRPCTTFTTVHYVHDYALRALWELKV